LAQEGKEKKKKRKRNETPTLVLGTREKERKNKRTNIPHPKTKQSEQGDWLIERLQGRFRWNKKKATQRSVRGKTASNKKGLYRTPQYFVCCC
jgi:hypothetical protein